MKLFIADKNKGDHRIYQPEGETRPSVEVEAVRLDEYFKDDRHGIDMIKMDTQGAEGVILEGMAGLFDRRSDGPTIFMEFWPTPSRRWVPTPAPCWRCSSPTTTSSTSSAGSEKSRSVLVPPRNCSPLTLWSRPAPRPI